MSSAWPGTDAVECPCCHYPLLPQRDAFEICALCWWEDDGQDDVDADVMKGGPNYSYSLTEARTNFQALLTMYRRSDDEFTRFRQAEPEVLACKRRIIEAFEEMRNLQEDAAIESLWAVVTNGLASLRQMRRGHE